MDVIIGVIISIVLCGLIILICACQKKEEKMPTTAQEMRNLSNQKWKESQEKQLQKDIVNSQRILSYLPVLIHDEAKKGWDMLKLSFDYGYEGGYIPRLVGFWDISPSWDIPALKNASISSQYMNTLIAKIEKFCKQNGFNIELKNIKAPWCGAYNIEISW